MAGFLINVMRTDFANNFIIVLKAPCDVHSIILPIALWHVLIDLHGLVSFGSRRIGRDNTLPHTPEPSLVGACDALAANSRFVRLTRREDASHCGRKRWLRSTQPGCEVGCVIIPPQRIFGRPESRSAGARAALWRYRSG